MARNDRLLFLVVPLVAAVLAFWFLAVKPKQDQASKLDDQVTQLQTQVSSDQQSLQQGRQSRTQFPRDYHRLVVMGKAVPVDDETASLVVQVNRIAKRSGVSFRAIDLNPGSSASGSAAATATTTSAVPTESSAALLPIGATVGSAGLPVLPYTMSFQGNYFQIAKFMAGVDDLVQTGKAAVQADGRLATIDAFSMAPPSSAPSGVLAADLAVTTYVTPASEGLTAGATPAGPTASPVTEAQSTVASQNASSTSTAAATP
jgi:Tfp pilus assembly protein PilO